MLFEIIVFAADHQGDHEITIWRMWPSPL